ncbi:ATP-grasp domain-containing protein [Streptomyces sp. NPDC088354]|uniref:ATP-grasp domain-containing protein n=1 Tax=Streptomyces sp. NPDC088354 TaxID=3365856 RepID=UPI0038182C76
MTAEQTAAPTLVLVGGARPVTVSVDNVLDALRQARARGIRTHVVAPAAALAATPAVTEAADAVSAVECTDPETLARWALHQSTPEQPFKAVYALQEMAQVAVAETAAALGVPGNAPDAVRRVRTKDLCRQALAEAGFRQPRVRLCERAEQAEEFMTQIPGPWVVKPRDAMGSTGVSLVEHREDLPAAMAALPERDRFLIEEFVPGPEFSVEGVFRQGRPQILAVTAKDKTAPPYFVELGHTLPAPLHPKEDTRVRDCVTAALATLGMRVGAFHVEVWLTPDEVVLGEVHGRWGGDWIHRMLAHAIPGLDIHGLIYDDMLGVERPHPEPAPSRGAAVRYFTPPPGRLVRVQGWEEVRRHQAVLYCELTAAVGDRIPTVRRSTDRVGLVVVGADSAREAEATARELIDSVVFTVEEDGTPC